MSQQYITVQNDVLDAICHAHYGRVDVLPQVLDANPRMAEQPERLPAGVSIELPLISRPNTQNKVINLWD